MLMIQRRCVSITLLLLAAACDDADPESHSDAGAVDTRAGAGAGGRAGADASVSAGQLRDAGADGSAPSDEEAAGKRGSAMAGRSSSANAGESGGADAAGTASDSDAGAAEAGTGGGAAADSGGAPASAMLCASCGACEEVQASKGALHSADPVVYPDLPPTSGTHNPCWTTWGVHDTEVAPNRWVHNLEHGGVVYLYNCPEGCAAEVEQMAALVAAQPRSLLTPYAALPQRFAVVSWLHRLVSACYDPGAYAQFYTENYDHGLESIASNPPVSCPP